MVFYQRFYGISTNKLVAKLSSRVNSDFALRMKTHVKQDQNVTYLVGSKMFKVTFPEIKFQLMHENLESMGLAYVANTFMVDEQLFWITQNEMCTWERNAKVVLSHHPEWVSKHLHGSLYRVVKYTELQVLLFCFYPLHVLPIVLHYDVVTGEFSHIVPTRDPDEITRTCDMFPVRIEVCVCVYGTLFANIRIY